MPGRPSSRRSPRRFRPVRETAAPRDPNARAILDWLKRRDLDHGVSFYTPEQWAARGEPYGDDALFTLAAEGAFNHLMNYPESREDDLLIAEFNGLLRRLGLRYEQGFAWSFHFHRDERATVEPTRNRAERDRLARKANEVARGTRVRGWPTLTGDSGPNELLAWMLTNDPNSTWDTAFEDGDVDENDLWDGLERYIAED